MSDNKLEHTDIIRIAGQSHDSFDDAINRALQELSCPSHGHNHHPGYTFKSFEVVKLSGYIHHDLSTKSCEVTHFTATIDVEAVHQHDDE